MRFRVLQSTSCCTGYDLVFAVSVISLFTILVQYSQTQRFFCRSQCPVRLAVDKCITDVSVPPES